MMESHEESTIIDMSEECNNTESDADNSTEEGSINEHDDNENDDSEDHDSENENDEDNVSDEDNNEQTVLSSNGEESDDSDKCEDNDMEDTQRQASSTLQTHAVQCIEAEVELEYTPQTKTGPKHERPTTSNTTPKSSNAQKYMNSKNWKGKKKSGNESSTKGHENCLKQNYSGQNNSRAGNRNIKTTSKNKHPNVSKERYTSMSSPVNHNSSNPKNGSSSSKGGNKQAWKNTSTDASNKNNSGNNSTANSTKHGGNANKGNENIFNTSNNKKNNNSNNNNNNNNTNSSKNNYSNKNNYNSSSYNTTTTNNNNSNNKKNKNIKQKNSEEPSPKNILKEAKDIVNSILKKKLCAQPLDSSILRLHYRGTVLLYVLLYTIIQGCWIWKESIICVYGHNAETQVPYHIKNFCLTYPFVYEDSFGPDGESQKQRRYLLFYRWTHHSFLVVASLFYIPRVIAKTLDNPRLKQLVHDMALRSHQYDSSNWEKDTNMMLQYMNTHASTHGYLYFWLIICHMVALAIDCLVVLYFDYVLQGYFMDLVYSAYPLHREPQFFTDYLSRTFPPFVNCTVEKQILINNAREEWLGCHLLLMDIYDKMFVFIWLWLVFLILSTGIVVIALILWVLPPFNRLFLVIQTDSKHIKRLRNKIIKKYSSSDLYVLHLMKRHRSEAQFVMLMSKLTHSEESSDASMEYDKRKAKVSFKEEMMSNAERLPEFFPRSGKEQWWTENTPYLSPVIPHNETIRSRKVDSSTPHPDSEIGTSFPRNFINEYKV